MSEKPVVLFVDDEPRLTAALKRQLRKEPFEVLEAISGAEALELLARREIDVVVTDEQMPGMTGADLVAAIFRDYPSVVRIMLSGQASLESAVKAINEGQIFRFLTKPCNAVDLAATIRSALFIRAATEENRRLRHTVATQAKVLHDLECEHPGIGAVRRDREGAVVIEAGDLATPSGRRDAGPR